MYYFVSDIHLTDDKDPKTEILVRFLDSLHANQCKKLFLLGDIFDLWVADHKVFQIKFRKTKEAIEALINRGVEVHYFEGNHDLYLSKFWEKELGVNVYTHPKSFQLDGLKIRLEHGDESNPEDKAYLRYRAFLRTSFMNCVAYLLPGSWIDYLGGSASRTSRGNAHRYPWNVKEVLSNYIQSLIRKGEDFDVLITGHMHERIDEKLEIENKKVRNINLGWWDQEQKALVLDEGEFYWLDLS